MKLHEIPAIFFRHYLTVAPAGEDALDEVLPQKWIMEPVILLYRCQWKVFHEDFDPI